MNIKERITELEQESKTLDREIAGLVAGRDPAEPIGNEIAELIRPSEPYEDLKPEIERRQQRQHEITNTLASLRALAAAGKTEI